MAFDRQRMTCMSMVGKSYTAPYALSALKTVSYEKELSRGASNVPEQLE